MCACFGCAHCAFYAGGHDPDTQECPKTIEQSQKNYDEYMRRREVDKSGKK